eukprot:PhM_4_TR2392/c0_g1_i2/m.49701
MIYVCFFILLCYPIRCKIPPLSFFSFLILFVLLYHLPLCKVLTKHTCKRRVDAHARKRNINVERRRSRRRLRADLGLGGRWHVHRTLRRRWDRHTAGLWCVSGGGGGGANSNNRRFLFCCLRQLLDIDGGLLGIVIIIVYGRCARLGRVNNNCVVHIMLLMGSSIVVVVGLRTAFCHNVALDPDRVVRGAPQQILEMGLGEGGESGDLVADAALGLVDGDGPLSVDPRGDERVHASGVLVVDASGLGVNGFVVRVLQHAQPVLVLVGPVLDVESLDVLGGVAEQTELRRRAGPTVPRPVALAQRVVDDGLWDGEGRVLVFPAETVLCVHKVDGAALVALLDEGLYG